MNKLTMAFRRREVPVYFERVDVEGDEALIAAYVDGAEEPVTFWVPASLSSGGREIRRHVRRGVRECYGEEQ